MLLPLWVVPASAKENNPPLRGTIQGTSRKESCNCARTNRRSDPPPSERNSLNHGCHILPFQPILWNRCFPSKSVKLAKNSPKSISEGGRIWQVCPSERNSLNRTAGELEKLLEFEPWPYDPRGETALQPLIWCSRSLSIISIAIMIVIIIVIIAIIIICVYIYIYICIYICICVYIYIYI